MTIKPKGDFQHIPILNLHPLYPWKYLYYIKQITQFLRDDEIVTYKSVTVAVDKVKIYSLV